MKPLQRLVVGLLMFGCPLVAMISRVLLKVSQHHPPRPLPHLPFLHLLPLPRYPCVHPIDVVFALFFFCCRSFPTGGGGPGSDSAPCKMSTANLSSRMQSAIDGVNAAAAANAMGSIKIIMTGYCVPMGAVLAEIGCTKDNMATLTSAYTKMAADNANVEFHDISTACQQKAEYFISDGLHLNAKGYCKSLSLSTVQTAFGCGEKTYDCATVKSTACDGKESTSAVGNDGGSGRNLGHGMTWVTLGAAVSATMMALAL